MAIINESSRNKISRKLKKVNLESAFYFIKIVYKLCKILLNGITKIFMVLNNATFFDSFEFVRILERFISSISSRTYSTLALSPLFFRTAVIFLLRKSDYFLQKCAWFQHINILSDVAFDVMIESFSGNIKCITQNTTIFSA